MTKLKTPALHALEILAGCPEGTTHHNLLKRHDIAPSAIYWLVRAGFVQPEERSIQPPHTIQPSHTFRVTWLRITEAGRAALNGRGAS